MFQIVRFPLLSFYDSINREVREKNQPDRHLGWENVEKLCYDLYLKGTSTSTQNTDRAMPCTDQKKVFDTLLTLSDMITQGHVIVKPNLLISSLPLTLPCLDHTRPLTPTTCCGRVFLKRGVSSSQLISILHHTPVHRLIFSGKNA